MPLLLAESARHSAQESAWPGTRVSSSHLTKEIFIRVQTGDFTGCAESVSMRLGAKAWIATVDAVIDRAFCLESRKCAVIDRAYNWAAADELCQFPSNIRRSC